MKKLLVASLLLVGTATGANAAPSGIVWQNGQRLTDSMLQKFDNLKANQSDLSNLSSQTLQKLNTIGGIRTGGSDVETDLTNAIAATNLPSAILRTLSKRFADVVNVRDFGAVCDGVTDDSTAFQAALNQAVSPGSHGRTVTIPSTGKCLISTSLTLVVRNAPVHIEATGKHGAMLVYPAAFNGVGFDVVLNGTDSAPVSFSMSGLTFYKQGATKSGTAFRITETGGVVDPSLLLAHNTFLADSGGSWGVGEDLENVNVDYNDDSTCFGGFSGTCVKYDSSGPIAVEHHITNLYVNGFGFTGLSVGHAGMTASLQGFTIDNASCTGDAVSSVCMTAIGAPHAIDQFIVRGSQISTATGISLTNVDSVDVTGNYFLGNVLGGINLLHGVRAIVQGNTFFANGTSNPYVTLDGVGGGSVGSSLISGNLFTGTVNGKPVALKNNTDYTFVDGNNCYETSTCVDISGIFAGYTHNHLGLNNTNNGPYTPSVTMTDGSLTNPLALIQNGEKSVKLTWSGDTYPLVISTDGAGNAALNIGIGTITLGPNVKVPGILQLGNGGAQIQGYNDGSITTSGKTTIGGQLVLAGYSKSDLLGIQSPPQGTIVNDNTDNTPVIYENGHWYPISLGNPLE